MKKLKTILFSAFILMTLSMFIKPDTIALAATDGTSGGGSGTNTYYIEYKYDNVNDVIYAIGSCTKHNNTWGGTSHTYYYGDNTHFPAWYPNRNSGYNAHELDFAVRADGYDCPDGTIKNWLINDGWTQDDKYVWGKGEKHTDSFQFLVAISIEKDLELPSNYSKPIYVRNQAADGSWGGYWLWVTPTGPSGTPYYYTGYENDNVYKPISTSGTLTNNDAVRIDAYRKTVSKSVKIQLQNADGTYAAAYKWKDISGLYDSSYSVSAADAGLNTTIYNVSAATASGKFTDSSAITLKVPRNGYEQVNNFYYWHIDNNQWYHFASRSAVQLYGTTYYSTTSGISANPPAGWEWADGPTYYSGFNKNSWTVTGYKNDVDGNGHFYPIDYYVSYNKNKPTNASSSVAGSTMDKSHYNYSGTGTLANCAYTLTGWDFTGWNRKADGSGTSYGNKASVLNWTTTADETIPIYAQWKAHTYGIQYMPNKPSIATSNVAGTVANTTHTYDTHYPVTQGENRGDTAGGDVKYDNGGVCNATRENTYTLTGWTFVGWSLKADGSSGIITDIYNFTATQGATVKVYAQWRPNTYTVVYDKNKPANASSDVLGTTANTTHKYDHQYNIDTSNDGIGNVYQATCSKDGTTNTTILRNNGYSLKGWIFQGWSTTKDGSSGILSNIKNLTATEKGSVTLYAQWKPITFKVVYHMNLPKNADVNVSSNGLSWHTTAGSSYNLPTSSTFYSGKSWLGKTISSTYSSSSTVSNYCYLGTKTYTYDSTDWALESLQITVNDAYFIGWTYYDIVYEGAFPSGSTNGTANGLHWNGVTNGDASVLTIAADGSLSSTNKTGTIIGGSMDSTYDVTKDYALKSLSMAKNPFYNVNQVNVDNGVGDIYLVLKANWASGVAADINYHSNNGSTESVYTQDLGNATLSKYINILGISDSALSNDLFGKPYNKFTTAGTASNMRLLDAWKLPNVTDTSFASGGGALGDDGSYDSTATGDQFVVNTDSNSQYHFGTSLGRKGFFSFQGWSTWKYASWRDNISSNRQDNGTAWNESNSYQPSGKDGVSTKTNVTTGTNGLAITKFNGGARSKRIGDLFYRYGVTTLSRTKSINGTANNANTEASDYTNGHTNTMSTQLYDAFKWRVTQGATGTYSQFVSLIKNPTIHLYAIWDSYVTTDISNVYVYTEDDSDDDIAVLTPKYLFSKVVAYDYEDLEAFGSSRYIGDSRAWSSVCNANVDMSSKTSGDKTYTYTISGSSGSYYGGTFKATLLNYDYNLFKEAKTSAINASKNSKENEVQSVALTWKFEDSAGNITYRTSWVYILDRTSSGAEDEEGVKDDTRHAITRFVDTNSYFGDGTHTFITGNGVSLNNDNSTGAVNDRSKWRINPAYTTELQNALSSLNSLGDSALTIDVSDVLGLKVGYSGDYHPENENGTWVYNWNNIKSKTEGIYQFDYNDILNSKKHDGRGNYESTNYSALQQYIDDILKDTAVNDHRVAN